jgi:hypothetical protein
MTKLIKAIQNLIPPLELRSIYRAMLSLVAVVFLFVSTACNGSEVTRAQQPNSASPQDTKVTELYKTIEPREGGMNNYSDVDPRMDTSEAKAKADRLIKKTDNLVNKDTNPFKEVRKEFDQKGAKDRAENFSKDLGKAVKENTKDFAKGTERGYENVKKNTKNFANDVGDAVDDRAQDLRNKANDNM